MENYEKEPSNIEHLVDPNPFEAPQYFHIEITKDKGVRNVANKVLKVFGPGKPVVLFAAGRATSHAVGCAEIVKASHRVVHQVTKVGQVRTIETWNPVAAGLDPLRVTRTVPMLYILLSLEPVDSSQEGYQKSSGKKGKGDIPKLSMSELEALLAEDCPPPQPGPQSPVITQSHRDKERPPL